MKKLLFVSLGLALAGMASGQVPGSDRLKKHYLDTYEHALKYNDLGLAINSLNNAIVEMPAGEEIAYKDTLSMLYFKNKDYLSCLLLSQEVYKANPTNTNALTRAGDCYQAAGDYRNAAEVFEKVAPLQNNPFYYYQLAVCQYTIKKGVEARTNIDKAIADTNSNHTAIIFVSPNGSQQQVPVSAAAINLKAIMLMDEKNYAQAKQLLQSALKIDPDFQGAQQNVIVCDNAIKGNKPKSK